ncbi:MAG: RNA polymerase sigma factor [Spirochaetia bacterium]|nr:RNA polymerase sigma factor [Spirochaetia bacterium]
MEERFEKLYRENARYVYNVALGILRNKAEAEDVMQNVFIKLFETYGSFRGESSIRTYLYRMAVNRSIDLIRVRSNRSSKLEQIELPQNTVNNQAKAELDSLMSRLPVELRTPILLSEIAGFSYKEISAILQLNIGTVKSRINRGMTRLKEMAAKEVMHGV